MKLGWRGLPLQGPEITDNGVSFTIWAPVLDDVKLRLATGEELEMERVGDGYYHLRTNLSPGVRYKYLLDEEEYPDPASRYQPHGVHGYSEVFDLRYKWSDEDWRGLELEKYVIYEVHVGTFTPEGTFEALMSKLAYLKELGVTAVELMPIAQFPGGRNWGYDGVYLYAPHNTYGTPKDLKRLVDACHQMGIAVVLDVVYNHLGPEGNYLWAYGPYFTDRYRTPWGDAVNLDGPQSEHVRAFLINNALYWLEEYHVDALRVDSVHAFHDMSAKHFLRELVEAVEEASKRLRREIVIFAESDLNDPKVIRPAELGGYGFQAQWLDDYHHALHVALTGEHHGYYADFNGISDLAKSLLYGYVMDGRRSEYRGRPHGAPDPSRELHQFVVFMQNHDQVGNRALGERVTKLAGLEAHKLGATLALLSPYIPLIFMGEEWAEPNPFLYFVSHSDPELIEAVRRGRKEEFKAFNWMEEPPDPQDIHTFLRSKLSWHLMDREPHSKVLRLYKRLLELRRELVSDIRRTEVQAIALGETLLIRYNRYLIVANFSKERTSINLGGRWRLLLDTSCESWAGPRADREGTLIVNEDVVYPFSACVYQLS